MKTAHIHHEPVFGTPSSTCVRMTYRSRHIECEFAHKSEVDRATEKMKANAIARGFTHAWVCGKLEELNHASYPHTELV